MDRLRGQLHQHQQTSRGISSWYSSRCSEDSRQDRWQPLYELRPCRRRCRSNRPSKRLLCEKQQLTTLCPDSAERPGVPASNNSFAQRYQHSCPGLQGQSCKENWCKVAGLTTLLEDESRCQRCAQCRERQTTLCATPRQDRVRIRRNKRMRSPSHPCGWHSSRRVLALPPGHHTYAMRMQDSSFPSSAGNAHGTGEEPSRL
jgi:hypothetical protein